MADSYQYTAFPDLTSIRLIYLEAGEGAEPISCKLKTVGLDHLPPFEAISYTWGPPDFSCDLLVDEKELKITPTLFGALRRFRFSSAIRILWADAVCINQQDSTERSDQVSIMRIIYERATRVLIWLGPSSDDVPVAWSIMDRILTLCQEQLARGQAGISIWKTEVVSAKQNSEWELPSFESSDWDKFQTFLLREYFRRAWIVQEIRVSRTAVAYCGIYEIPWDDIYVSCTWITRKSYTVNLSRPLSTWGPVLIGTTSRGAPLQRVSLIKALRSIRTQVATDPRDKVFSILGLTNEFADYKDHRLVPDYSKSTPRVFCDVTKFIIETTGNLDILSHNNMPELYPGGDQSTKNATDFFPSWAPRFDKHRQNHEQVQGLGDLRKASAHLRASLVMPSDEMSLGLRGIQFDVVKRHTCPILDNVTPEVFDDIWSDLATQCLAYTAENDRLWAFYMAMTAGMNIQYQSAENDPSHRVDIWAYEQLRAQSTEINRRKSPTRIDIWSETPQIGNSEGDAARFQKAVDTLTYSRSIFTTERGYLGNGPSTLQKGDVVCILFGGRLPFILRRKESYWQFLGDCYVHGILGGEALKDFDGDVSHAEIFEMR